MPGPLAHRLILRRAGIRPLPPAPRLGPALERAVERKPKPGPSLVEWLAVDLAEPGSERTVICRNPHQLEAAAQGTRPCP